jgi:hypothetical protein
MWRGHLSRASPSKLAQYATQPCWNISHIQVLVTKNEFLMPPIKLKLGLQVGESLLNSNPLGPIKLSTQSETPGSKQSINTIWPYLLDCSKPLKDVEFFRVPAVSLSSGFTWFDWWTISKISSAGSHTEHWRRCSYYIHTNFLTGKEEGS